MQKKIPIYPKRIKKTILKVLSGEGAKISGEITVCFVSDKRIRQLNKKFHHRDEPTDVLAFNISDSNKRDSLSADIIISTQTALRQAKIYNSTFSSELNLYAAHGMLHLLGYNDRTLKQKILMQRKEKEYVHT